MRARLVLLALLASGAAQPTAAEDVLLSASGTINAVSAGLGEAFAPGQRINFQLLYDPASANNRSDGSFGSYPEAIQSFTVSAEGFSARAPAGELRVADNYRDAGDIFVAESTFSEGLQGSSANDLPLTRIAFQLWDSSAGAWDSHGLPRSFPAIEAFDNLVFTLEFIDSNNTYIATGLLDRLGISVVPPAAP